MISPELSLIIVPIVIIAAILVSYTLFLIKLQPTKENKKEPASGKEIEKERVPITVSEMTEETTRPSQPGESSSEEPEAFARESRIESADIENHHTSDSLETGKGSKKKYNDKELKKSFFLFGSNEFQGCSHKLGHLKNLPKNTPIPEECFGCPQILECLGRPMRK